MEPPSPQTLELLLTKLARLRLKVAAQKQAMLEWPQLTAAEHRLQAWELEANREKLAELELLVWLASQAQVPAEVRDASGAVYRTTRPLLVPDPAPATPTGVTRS